MVIVDVAGADGIAVVSVGGLGVVGMDDDVVVEIEGDVVDVCARATPKRAANAVVIKKILISTPV